jgi:quercetin dioxygenase-like cupin family protein
MEVEPKAPTTQGPAERFTGSVWVDGIAQTHAPSRFGAALVRFAPGSRTAWHVHALGQTLRITQGTAIVRTRDGHTIIAHPGQTVYTPPGEWHWHGATETDFMEHLALSESVPPEDGPTVTWGEHVSDDDYRQAHQSIDEGITDE